MTSICNTIEIVPPHLRLPLKIILKVDLISTNNCTHVFIIFIFKYSVLPFIYLKKYSELTVKDTILNKEI